jgi:ATP-binding cassette subfamily F protein uup
VVTSVLSVEPDGQVRESGGGYDDWLRRSEIEAKAQSKASTEVSKASGAASKEKSKKLGYKEKRELEELPKKIETLESELARIHEEMGNPSFYQQDRAEIARVNARLAEIEAELKRSYERWESLEEIDG